MVTNLLKEYNNGTILKNFSSLKIYTDSRVESVEQIGMTQL